MSVKKLINDGLNYVEDILYSRPNPLPQTAATEASPLDILYPKGGNMNLRNYFNKVGTSGFPKNVLLDLVPQGVKQVVTKANPYIMGAIGGYELGKGLYNLGKVRYGNQWANTPDGTAIDYARQRELQDWQSRYVNAGGKDYEKTARLILMGQGNANPREDQYIPVMEQLYAQDRLENLNKKQQPQQVQSVAQVNPEDYILPYIPTDSIEQIINSRSGSFNPNESYPDISQAPGNVVAYDNYQAPTTSIANPENVVLRGYADNEDNDTVTSNYDFNNLNNYLTPSEASYQQFLSQSSLLDPNKLVDLIKKSDRERYKYEVMRNMMAPKNIVELPSGAFVAKSEYQAPQMPMTDAEAMLKAYDVMGKAYKLQTELEDKALQRQGAIELAKQMGMSPALLNNEKVLTEIIKGKNAIDKARTVGEEARLTNESEIKAKSVANKEITKLKYNMEGYLEAYKQGNRILIKKYETELKKDLLDYGANSVQAKNIIQMLGTLGSTGQDPTSTLQLINTLYPGSIDLNTSNTFNNQMMINQGDQANLNSMLQ